MAENLEKRETLEQRFEDLNRLVRTRLMLTEQTPQFQTVLPVINTYGVNIIAPDDAVPTVNFQNLTLHSAAGMVPKGAIQVQIAGQTYYIVVLQ